MCCKHDCQEESSCITTVPVFNGMSKTELKKLQDVTNSKDFKKGSLIFSEGENSQALFVVNKGIIKMSKISADGKEQIVRFLFPGDFFGLSALLRDEKHYMNAQALEYTTICFLRKKEFLQTLERNPDMSFRFLLAMNDRLQEADESVGFLSLLEAEQRLARALLMFNDKMNANGQSFTLPIAKKDLASFVGTTPETVSRKLVAFESQNIISMNGRREIKILQIDRLQEAAALL